MLTVQQRIRFSVKGPDRETLEARAKTWLVDYGVDVEDGDWLLEMEVSPFMINQRATVDLWQADCELVRQVELTGDDEHVFTPDPETGEFR